jgi:hypothetical protein
MANQGGVNVVAGGEQPPTEQTGRGTDDCVPATQSGNVDPGH